MNHLPIPLTNSDSDQDDEGRLAFWLENVVLGDPAVFRVLAGYYAADLYSLLLALGELGNRAPVTHKEILTILEEAFRMLGAGIRNFRGQESVRSWLYTLALKAWRRKHHHPVRRRETRNVGTEKPGSTEPEEVFEEALNAWLEELPEKLQIAIILQYGHHLSTDSLNGMVEGRLTTWHHNLAQAWDRMKELMEAVDIRPQEEDEWEEQEKLAGSEPLLPLELQAHLEKCTLCQSYVEQSRPFQMEISRAIHTRWQAPTLTEEEIERLVNAAHAGYSGKGVVKPWTARGKEYALLAVILIAVLGVGWVLGRQDTHKGQPLFEVTPEAMPTPLSSTQVPVLSAGEAISESSEYINYMETILSPDGNSLAFTILLQHTGSGEDSADSQLYTLDLNLNKMEQISITPAGETAHGQYHSPGFSADGSLLVFGTDSASLVSGDIPMCDWPEGALSCYDIFVRNLVTGRLDWISLAPDGSPGDWHSFSPMISGDGNVVAFWSGAHNLVSSGWSECEIDGMRCVDIYLYDRTSGEMQVIPIGRKEMANTPSISQDGRWLALTLFPEDEVASRLGITERQAYVYDRRTGYFAAVNQTITNVPGNGASDFPVLTPDGRYVAFASLANNLVPGDTNAKADVFVRDRNSGMIERVSVSSSGNQGDGNSGAFFQNFTPWGKQIVISKDGRFVSFVSLADNLAPGGSLTCPAGSWLPCSYIYYHDRQEGETFLAIEKTQLNAIYLSVDINADGHWVSLVQYDTECPRYPYCSRILLYDTLTKHTRQPLDWYRAQGIGEAGGWRDVLLLEDTSGRVNSLAFSPDGSWLAGGTQDGVVNLWRVTDGALIQRWAGHTLPVSSVAFSPDSYWLASAARDGKVKIFQLDGIDAAYTLPSLGGPLLNLAISPDGTQMEAGSVGVAWTWDSQDRTFPVLNYTEYPNTLVNRVAFSPDGNLVAHALDDHTVWLRRTADYQVVARLSGHSDKVLSLAFSNQGDYFASGGADGLVNVWKIDHGSKGVWQFNRILSLQHLDWIIDLNFSPNGSMLAVAPFGGGVSLWRMPGGELLQPNLGVQWRNASSVAFSPDGMLIAIASSYGGVSIWQIPPDLP